MLTGALRSRLLASWRRCAWFRTTIGPCHRRWNVLLRGVRSMTTPPLRECLTDAAVLDIVAGIVSDGEWLQVGKHIEQCEVCRQRIEDITQTVPESDPDVAFLNVVRAPPTLEVPDIEGFSNIRPIGLGGLGTVFSADAIATGERVALKVAKHRAMGAAESLRREIRLLEVLRHPGMIQMRGHGRHEGRPWLAMEMIAGPSLEELLLRERHQAEGFDADCLTRFLRLTETLSFLHREGVVHRDLTPRNVLVRSADARSPVLIDFGLARYFAGRSGRETLEVGGIAGTMHYMSPEQLRGGLVDARSDLYSLGCILYHLLVGQPPFAGRNLREVMRAHLHEVPVPPSDLRRVDPALEFLTMRLLEKHPPQRLGYAEEVCEELVKLGAQPWPSAPKASVHDYVYRADFAGRKDLVLDVLEAARQCASQDGNPALFLVGGESGAGKTRALSEIGTELRRSGYCVVSGVCGAVSSSQRMDSGDYALAALRPLFLELVERCAVNDSQRIQRLLGERLGLLCHYIPELRALSRSVPGSQPELLAGEAATARLVVHARETLVAMASNLEPRPLAIILDDFQWSDRVSRTVICRLTTELLAHSRLLVLASYRTEEATSAFRREVAQIDWARRYNLPRLSATETKAVIGGMLAVQAVPLEFAGYVYSQTDGNPFFVHQYVQALVEDGFLTRLGGSWRFVSRADAPPVAGRQLPNNASQVILHRLDRLSAEVRAMLNLASVLGSRVPKKLLLAAAALRETGTASQHSGALQELVARQILGHDGTDIRFAHDRIWEVTYDALGEAERRQLHTTAVAALTASPPAAQAAWKEVVARHLRGAGEYNKAANWFASAGELAFDAADYAVAVRSLAEAITLVGEHDLTGDADERARWRYLLGQAHYFCGDSERSVQHLIAAMQWFGVAWPKEPRALRWFALKQLTVQLWHVAVGTWRRPRHSQHSRAWYIAQAGARVGFLGAWMQDTTAMLAAMLLSANHADMLAENHCPRSYGNLAFVTGMLGLARFERYYLRRAYAAAAGETDCAHVMHIEGYVRAGHGQWRPARELLEESLQVFVRYEESQNEGNARAALGFVARCVGDYETALRHAAVLAAGARRYGNVEQEIWSAVLAASTLLRRGDARAALEYLTLGEKLLRRAPEWVCELRAQAQMAHALLDLQQPMADVECYLTKAMETVARRSGPPVIASALDGLASLAHVALTLWRDAQRDGRAEPNLEKRARSAVAYLAGMARRFPVVGPYYLLCRARVAVYGGRTRAGTQLLERAERGAARLGMPFERALCDWHRADWSVDEAQRRCYVERAEQRFRELGRTLGDRVPG